MDGLNPIYQGRLAYLGSCGDSVDIKIDMLSWHYSLDQKEPTIQTGDDQVTAAHWMSSLLSALALHPQTT